MCGEMIGVRFNKNFDWVGGNICFFEERAIIVVFHLYENHFTTQFKTQSERKNYHKGKKEGSEDTKLDVDSLCAL